MTNISLSKLRKLPYDIRLNMAAAQNSLSEIHLLMKEHPERDHKRAEKIIINKFGIDGVLKTIRTSPFKPDNLCQYLINSVEFVTHTNYYTISPTVFIGRHIDSEVDKCIHMFLKKNIELYNNEDPRNVTEYLIVNVREIIWNHPSVVDDTTAIDMVIGHLDSRDLFKRFFSFSKNDELKKYIKDSLIIRDIII